MLPKVHYFLIDWPFYTYGMAYYWTYESEALVKYTDITEDFHNTSSFSHAHSSAALAQKGELIFLEQSCRSDRPRHLIQTLQRERISSPPHRPFLSVISDTSNAIPMTHDFQETQL